MVFTFSILYWVSLTTLMESGMNELMRRLVLALIDLNLCPLLRCMYWSLRGWVRSDIMDRALDTTLSLQTSSRSTVWFIILLACFTTLLSFCLSFCLALLNQIMESNVIVLWISFNVQTSTHRF